MARRRNEGFANTSPFASTHRNVLQVGVRAGQSPSDGRGLRVMRVHTPGGGVDPLRQLVAIGVLELGDAAVFQQESW